MDNQTYNQIVSFIWGIADDCLRDVYVRGKYRDVILPMVVIRRLDAVLEDTKQAVIDMKTTLDKQGFANQDEALANVAGQAFSNSSPFKLKDLTARAKKQQLKADFIAYLDGFSPNVQEILEKFKFRNQIDTMIDADILGSVIEKFVSPAINLSPNPVLDDDGKVKLPALDNHSMGMIFEELIRKFNEENNEEAGEHFTPRDVIELMADLIFMPIADQLKSNTYSCYDGAIGTGGMLTVAEERLSELGRKEDLELSIHLYGQEINPETYAIAKADLLLKGEGNQANNIMYGSTLSSDAFPTLDFDFMLSNPPYGKAWKTDLEKLGGKKDVLDPRFLTQFKDDPEFSMIPRVSDGQMLFLLNNVAKMKNHTELGSRIAEVHNGSSLFTGDAGQGESNARRFLIENDLVEAIIALPEKIFYNTGIGTFIWLLSNRKDEKRKGKIQLIDATNIKTPLRKNLGEKNCEISQEQREEIVNTYLNFTENDYSKIFDNKEFGYFKISVYQPLKQSILINDQTLFQTKSWFTRLGVYDEEEGVSEKDFLRFMEENPDARTMKIKKPKAVTDAAKLICEFVKIVENLKQEEPYRDLEEFKALYNNHHLCSDKNLKYDVVDNAGFFSFLTQKDENGYIVRNKKGDPVADKSLNDTEQIPLLYEGGIEAFFEKEVLPFAPEAWIEEKETKIGYEISFTKYFYKPIQLRSLTDIKADIVAIEAETDGLLAEILGGLSE